MKLLPLAIIILLALSTPAAWAQGSLAESWRKAWDATSEAIGKTTDEAGRILAEAADAISDALTKAKDVAQDAAERARGKKTEPPTTPTPQEENTMPIIHVDLLEGRSVESKRAYVKAITDCTVEILKCNPESVTIILSEVSVENFGQGGKLRLDFDEQSPKTS